MKVKVSTIDTELEFENQPKTKTIALFDQISKSLGIHEYWYFGLCYNSLNNEDIWIDRSKKTISKYKSVLNKLKYRVKFFPEEVEDLIEDNTINYFYLQIRSYILSDRIYCPPDTCVLLASYASQARHGDFNEEIHNKGFLSKERLLPQRVIDQHKMELDAWEDSIMKMWKKHNGILKEEAMMEYLKLTQNLEMFGIHYFNICNKKGTQLLLGIGALGLNVYKEDDKLNPTIGFPWSEISNINFIGKKFTIRPVDKTAKPFIFYSKDGKINKRILQLGIGYHGLYVNRRKQDSLEITRMKAKAAEKRQFMLEQRKKLKEEILARQQAEEREKSYVEQISSLKKELSKSQSNLLDAQALIQKLREQLEELQKSKEQLEEQQRELQTMMMKLEESKSLEEAERIKLEEEIKQKQLEVLKFQEEVNQKNEEARRLQEAVEEAKKAEEEMKIQRERDIKIQEEIAEKARIEAERLAKLLEEKEKHSKQDLKEDLTQLKQMLEEVRDETKETENDRIHRQNLEEGRDKYQTLKNIRKGNTTRRVDLFENF